METKPLYPIPETLAPPELRQALEQSVQTFRDRWGFMTAWAEQKGYIENYRQELERIAILAYKQGIGDAKQ